MNVGLSIHNLVLVGILAALFRMLMQLAAGTALRNVPVLGDGIALLAA